jgi:signal transduction histidine kinase
VTPDDGTAPKLIGVSMDVTARKQAEASAAQKRAELEHMARVATLGELTATLTHELGQPLAVINTNAYVCGRLLDAPEPDLPQVRSMLTGHLRGQRARRRSPGRDARHAQARQHGGARRTSI